MRLHDGCLIQFDSFKKTLFVNLGLFAISVAIGIGFGSYVEKSCIDKRNQRIMLTHEQALKDSTAIYGIEYLPLLEYLAQDNAAHAAYVLCNTIDMPCMTLLDKYLYYEALIEVSCSVDPCTMMAIAFVESSFNPKAISNKGAMGLHQIMPSTAKYIANKYPILWYKEDLHDIRSNTFMAAYVLTDRLLRHGQLDLALSSYYGWGPYPSSYSKKVLKQREIYINIVSSHPQLKECEQKKFDIKSDLVCAGDSTVTIIGKEFI